MYVILYVHIFTQGRYTSLELSSSTGRISVFFAHSSFDTFRHATRPNNEAKAAEKRGADRSTTTTAHLVASPS